ncbi:ankyrin repeat domain-containing protein [Wolbachia endosymbiont of Psylliodes chrysocephala]|uniref:ankyrin repeat domain-containing protein n=1 Tax=Wolbachia endosymbiont of Psylliodes chrysocephala TaxID=2883236 RepID=UPI00209FC972|nr:ankyrin repeat domain-containing protein [Wolbachia endosymbiont of Psylliodes chrysocephala]
MAIEHEEWKKISSAVNDDKDLNKDNVIDKIKEELKKYPEEYKKWEKVGFDVNHLFEVESDKCTLLHLAAYEAIFDDLGDVANALLGVEGINVDAKDCWGNTLLHVAAKKGHIDVVNALIKMRLMLMRWINVDGLLCITLPPMVTKRW